MRVTNAYRMADRLLDGHLAEFISERRAAEVSWDDIARQLEAEYGVRATGQTVARWAEISDETNETKAAS